MTFPLIGCTISRYFPRFFVSVSAKSPAQAGDISHESHFEELLVTALEVTPQVGASGLTQHLCSKSVKP